MFGGTSKVGEAATSAAGGAEAGGMKGLAGIVGKLGILIGAIMLIVDAIKGLAPIQAILKMLVAIIQITLYPIAQFFLAIFKPIVVMLLKNFIIPFYTKVMPVIEMFGKWLSGMLAAGMELAGKAVEDFQKSIPGQIFGIWLDSVIALWKNIFTIIIGIIKIIIEVMTVQLENLVTIVTTMISIIVTYFSGMFEIMSVIINTGIEVITAIFTGKWDEIPGIISAGWVQIQSIILTKIEIIKTLVSDAWTRIKTNILEHIEGIKKTIADTWEKIKTNLKEAFDSIYNHIVNIFGVDIVSKVKEIFTNIFNAITSTISGIINWIKQTISNLMGGGGGGGGGGRGMAEGGIVTRPTVALIGEAGPEAVIPLNKMGSIGGTTIVNVSFPNMRVEKDVDIDDIVAKIERNFYTNSKRSGVK